MRFSLARLIFTEIILVAVMGVIVNNIGVGQVCTFIPFALLPCSFWNASVVLLIVAIILESVFAFSVPRIFKLKRNDIRLKIDAKREPSYMQAKTVGISIKNNGGRDIAPLAKILGKIKVIEYFDDGSEKSNSFSPDSRVIGSDENWIGGNDDGKLFFARVENNENVSLLTKNPYLIKSFYGVESGFNNANRIRWEFNFELFGKVRKEGLFKKEIYFIFIDSYIRNGEVFVQIGEPEVIKVVDEN